MNEPSTDALNSTNHWLVNVSYSPDFLHEMPEQYKWKKTTLIVLEMYILYLILYLSKLSNKLRT